MNCDVPKTIIPNPHLVVGDDRLIMWNRPEHRRWGFQNLHWLSRYALSIRSSHVLPLRLRIDRRIGEIPSVQRLTSTNMFTGIIVVQGDHVLFERYASDFGPDMPHAIQSISKTALNLIYGPLVERDEIDLSAKVERYLPDICSGYRGTTVQDVLDMNVTNNFDESFSAPYGGDPEGRVGYLREEVSFGWRVPPDGERELSARDFVMELKADGTSNTENLTHYKSPTSELAGWIAEVASGIDLKRHLSRIVNGAGLEHAFKISLDREFVPILSSGGSMTARDLARYGLLFARRGVGVQGDAVGSEAFLTRTLGEGGTWLDQQGKGRRYHNKFFTDGTVLAHSGYGGQYLVVHPDKEAVVGFFSVLEDSHASDETYADEIASMAADVLDGL